MSLNMCFSIVLLKFSLIPYISAQETWTDWADYGCTDTCGQCGTVIQARICLSQPCTGPSTRNTTKPCGDPICAFPRPACCAGSTRGIIGNQYVCISNLPPIDNSPPAPPSPPSPPSSGEQGAWTEWTESCSQPCGNCGHIQRTRVCSVPGTCQGVNKEETNIVCGPSVCTFPKVACCNGTIKVVQNGIFNCVIE